MLLDREVWQRKFDEQVRRVRANEARLQRWGCYVVSCAPPEIRTIWLPPAGVTLTMPLVARVSPQGVELIAFELHSVAPRSFGVVVDLDDYDQRAPSVVICDPITWEPLKHGQFHGALQRSGSNVQRLWIEMHPMTKRPFLCIRGFREYHEHPQHDGDPWVLQRGDVDVLYVLSAIHQTCILGARAQINLGMQLNLHVIPAPREEPMQEASRDALEGGEDPQGEAGDVSSPPDSAPEAVASEGD